MEKIMNNNIEKLLEKEYMKIGVLSITSANNTIEKALVMPEPQDLYKGLWHEGEVACLFADSNVGKSILAVQIGEEISKKQKVLYLDFELSDKQFQIRYSNNETGEYHIFPREFYRATIYPIDDNHGDSQDRFHMSYEDRVIKDIEEAAVFSGSKVIIVDNLSFLCNASDKGDVAGILMMRLIKLKMKYGWSLLIIAHTPKRDPWSSITPNDLAGSKKLFNFFDTIFAIGKCHNNENYRYIKQLKVRTGEFIYTDDHVMICELGKADGINLVFSIKGYGFEREMLRDSDEEETIRNICRLRQEGLSIRDIAAKLNMSKSKVGRLSQYCNGSKCTFEEEVVDAEEVESLSNVDVDDEDVFDNY